MQERKIVLPPNLFHVVMLNVRDRAEAACSGNADSLVMAP